MESAENRDTKHYYDLNSGKLIVGQEELDSFLSQAQDTTGVYALGNLLRNTDIEVPGFVYQRKPKRTKAQLLQYGKWLHRVAMEAEASDQRELNSTIIHRAGRLGIGPTIWEITKHPAFGTLSRYYAEIGITGTRRAGAFDGWSSLDFGEYIKRVAEELGRKPTRDDLLKKSKDDAKSPSLNVIISRTGSLGHAYELGGYPNARHWDKDDFISWGVRFMRANDGLLPSQSMIDYFSKKKLCASASTFAKNFDNSLLTYQSQLIDDYRFEIERERIEHAKKIEDISTGRIPNVVFQDAESEDEKITRYARYMVVDHLFPESHAASKISIAAMSNETVRRDGFIRAVRKLNYAITAGEIESVALFLNVFDDLWPMKDYMETLRLPAEMLPPPKRRPIVAT